MGIYLDSVAPEDARLAQELGFLEGITTSPALIAQAGRPGLDILSDLADIFDGHIFYQLTAPTLEARTDEAWQAYQIRPDKVILKVPATTENLALVSRLVPAGIECAVTAVYNPTQVFLATQVGASFVIPYISQLPDATRALRDMVQIVAPAQTEILAAGFSSLEDVTATILAGVKNLTMPLDLIMAMGEHDLSQQDIADSA
ncbi:MAG: hypothetical protein JXQ72_06520 [Anaerolineae bacterium]|nr:hypothetical protein [Anaerolineae bacterium]